jgi:hypothetical protein
MRMAIHSRVTTELVNSESLQSETNALSRGIADYTQYTPPVYSVYLICIHILYSIYIILIYYS